MELFFIVTFWCFFVSRWEKKAVMKYGVKSVLQQKSRTYLCKYKGLKTFIYLQFPELITSVRK